jgi:hypothetical protein
MMTLFAIDSGRRVDGGINGPRLHTVSPVTAAAGAAGAKRLAFSGWFKSHVPIPPTVKKDNLKNALKALADATLVVRSDGQAEPLGGHDGTNWPGAAVSTCV